MLYLFTCSCCLGKGAGDLIQVRDIIRLVNLGDILNGDVEKEMGSSAVQSCGCTLMY